MESSVFAAAAHNMLQETRQTIKLHSHTSECHASMLRLSKTATRILFTDAPAENPPTPVLCYEVSKPMGLAAAMVASRCCQEGSEFS